MLDVEVVVVVTMRAGNAGNVEGRENSVRFHYLCFERGRGEQHSEQSLPNECPVALLFSRTIVGGFGVGLTKAKLQLITRPADYCFIVFNYFEKCILSYSLL